MVWDREDGRTTVESYWDSSMSIRSWRVAIPKDFSCQWIPRQNLRAEAERLHPSYTLWVGMDMTERPTQDFEKNGWSGIGKTEGPRGGILLDARGIHWQEKSFGIATLQLLRVRFSQVYQ